jgi:hypothetical protein
MKEKFVEPIVLLIILIALTASVEFGLVDSVLR